MPELNNQRVAMVHSSLPKTMSLPAASQPSKQLWLTKLQNTIQEQASAASSAVESTGSNTSLQLQSAGEHSNDGPATAENETFEDLLGCGLHDGLASKITVRRSSGSGGKVVGMGTGLEVASSVGGS
jgi:hypothetical protein